MRILHLLNHTRRLNGHVHAAVDLACAQRKLGHTVAIASEGGGDFDKLLAANGIETMTLSHQRRPGPLVKSVMNLNGLVRKWRADVVHAHMMTSAVLAYPVCTAARIPLVTTVHNEFEKSSILMGLGTCVIAVSSAVGESMIKRGISRSRLHVVLNGTIGAARFDGKNRTPRKLASPAVVFVGGMHPRKGLPDLLTAFDSVHRDHPGAHLYVLGGGPSFDGYVRQAAGLACAAAVTFEGPVDDPYSCLLGADIFVLPSHADPAPLVLSEAREAGCAIIATRVDGIPQLLEEGEAGILVAPHDPVGIAEALARLMDDPAQLLAWRRKSQVNIDNLRIERVALETLAVYSTAYRKVRKRHPEHEPAPVRAN